jgi:hypothetical protein
MDKGFGFIIIIILVLLASSQNTWAQPREIAANVRASGVIDPTSAVQYYSFTANVGDVVHIETYAARLTPRSPLDTVLSLLTGDQQKTLAVNDDIEIAAQKDSFISFAIPATGSYVIKVESFESFMGLPLVGGPDFKYELRWITTTDNKLVYFPQIIDGALYTTTILLANSSASPASGSINLIQSQGRALLALLNGQLTSSVRFTIPANGTLRLETELSSDLRAGWAQVIADTPLNGSVIFQARYGDQILSEAGVSAALPTRSFSMFAYQRGSTATGMALVNPGTQTATITFTLRNKNGDRLSSTTRSLAPYEHSALFTHELFDLVQGMDEFEGSIDVASTSDLVAVTLRFNSQDIVFTTVPVVFGSGSNRILFPQVADGANFSTTFVLINNSDNEARGSLRLFQSDGTPFLLMLRDGRTSSSFGEDVIRVPAHGVLRLQSSGAGSLFRVGWAELSSNVPIGGNAIFQASDGNRIISEAGVSVLDSLRQFVLFADTLSRANTGLAVANPSEQAANLTLQLLNRSGEEVSRATLSLRPREHTARFISELFRNFGGIDEFEGLIVVRSDSAISPITLRLDNPNHNVFTTLPVSELSSSSR